MPTEQSGTGYSSVDIPMMYQVKKHITLRSAQRIEMKKIVFDKILRKYSAGYHNGFGMELELVKHDLVNIRLTRQNVKRLKGRFID